MARRSKRATITGKNSERTSKRGSLSNNPLFIALNNDKKSKSKLNSKSNLTSNNELERRLSNTNTNNNNNNNKTRSNGLAIALGLEKKTSPISKSRSKSRNLLINENSIGSRIRARDKEREREIERRRSRDRYKDRVIDRERERDMERDRRERERRRRDRDYREDIRQENLKRGIDRRIGNSQISNNNNSNNNNNNNSSRRIGKKAQDLTFKNASLIPFLRIENLTDDVSESDIMMVLTDRLGQVLKILKMKSTYDRKPAVTAEVFFLDEDKLHYYVKKLDGVIADGRVLKVSIDYHSMIINSDRLWDNVLKEVRFAKQRVLRQSTDSNQYTVTNQQLIS